MGDSDKYNTPSKLLSQKVLLYRHLVHNNCEHRYGHISKNFFQKWALKETNSIVTFSTILKQVWLTLITNLSLNAKNA